MIHNFPDMDKENAQLEHDFQSLKTEYQKIRMSKEQFHDLRQKMKEVNMIDQKQRNHKTMIKIATTAAALICAFIILPNTSVSIAHAMEQIPILGQLVKVVTFRDYEYESERNMADIKVPEISVAEPVTENPTTNVEAITPEAAEHLTRTTEEINAEIQKITDELITEFEANLNPENHQDVVVKSETLTTTPNYFTLKLICYQGAGSGYEWNYFYTIDLNTGERLQLKDIFEDGADYITPISENIKEQMRTQMAADEMVAYWLDDPQVEEWNFNAITDETSFYINKHDHVVICFNEGDVAPMYMGTVEFEIPQDVLKDIRK